ncbi:MAG: acyl-CoA thioesterase [Planctomycetales bacterium]|nr:acyl-CoA thioesterase [Planctomycetales bacterium]
MSEQFRTQRRVEFCETDAAGIAHFSAFFTYMEQAEHALLRELGTSVVRHEGEAVVSWPRVSASCDYQGMVRFEQVLDIEVAVERIGGSSVAYQFRFSHEGRPVAQGKMVSVCCRIEPGQPPKSTPIAPELVARLRRFLVDTSSSASP